MSFQCIVEASLRHPISARLDPLEGVTGWLENEIRLNLGNLLNRGNIGNIRFKLTPKTIEKDGYYRYLEQCQAYYLPNDRKKKQRQVTQEAAIVGFTAFRQDGIFIQVNPFRQGAIANVDIGSQSEGPKQVTVRISPIEIAKCSYPPFNLIKT